MNTEPTVEYTDTKILIKHDGKICKMSRIDEESDKKAVERYLDMLKLDDFYKSDEYKKAFAENLETVILATRGGGSGAIACRDALLSLLNGDAYKLNLSLFHNLDKTNLDAILYVIKHHIGHHATRIDNYLPQYKLDFKRMQEEVNS